MRSLSVKIEGIEQVGGNANQVKIFTENEVMFYSYGSLIAYKFIGEKTLYFTDKWDYSRTTLKHLKLAFIALNDKSKNEIEEMIKQGLIILV